MNEMYDQGVVGLNLAPSKDLFHIRTAPLVYLPMVVKLQVISSYVRSTTINIQHSIYKYSNPIVLALEVGSRFRTLFFNFLLSGYSPAAWALKALALSFAGTAKRGWRFMSSQSY